MKPRMPKKFLDIRGSALVELAILLPFLVLMVVGVFDFSRAIHAKNIITNMSREGTNLAARSGLDATKAQEIMNSLSYTAQPLNMDANGMMYISVVQGTGTTGSVVPRITTQYGWKNRTAPASRIGSVGNNAVGLGPLSLTNGLSSGEVVYVVEVFYRYRSVFFSYLGLDRQMYSMTVF